jgi:hypothetical protein
MRPKKRILLLSNDECRAGILAFNLVIHSYIVDRALLPSEAFALSLNHYDLVIFDLPFEGAISVANWLNSIPWHIPTVGIAPKPSELHSELLLDACVARSISSAELLDRILVMAARKRGPRPHRKPVVNAELVMQVAEVSA